MCTTARIRRYIANLAENEIFTTRDALNYGSSRAAVDEALYRMVKSGELLRLARGVFIKFAFGKVLPSVLEVAQAKARSFGREISIHGANAAHALKLPSPKTHEPTYATSGRTSKFLCRNSYVYFKALCPRKLKLGDDPAGLVIRGLWHLGRKAVSMPVVVRAMLDLGRSDRQRLRYAKDIMPAWMAAYVG